LRATAGAFVSFATGVVDGLVEDYAHYARGEAESVSPHVREVTGTDPRDVGRFAEDYASAFAGT